MAAERIHASQGRLGFLDWTRGFGALIMLQGHITHSFMAGNLREGSLYTLSQFIGGMPPAIFLFLTGLTLGFLMDSLDRKEPSLVRRIIATLMRARYLFVIAFLFRIQMWAFALPYSRWVDIFRVDILNCMGFAVLLLAWLVIPNTRSRVVYAAAAGLFISFFSPIVTTTDLSLLPAVALQYIVPDERDFSFFPWGAFLAFGISAGSLLRIVPAEHYGRMMQWAMLLGLTLIYLSQYASNLPYSLYAESNFWLDGPGLTLIKTGIVMVMGALGYLWMSFLEGRFSWVALLGQHSLPVYWVHIELTYGRLADPFKKSLDTPKTVFAALIMIALMVALASMKARYDRGEFPRLREQINRRWPIPA